MTEKILAERHLSKRDTLAETHIDLETLKKQQCRGALKQRDNVSRGP